jgi:hypothetical protein
MLVGWLAYLRIGHVEVFDNSLSAVLNMGGVVLFFPGGPLIIAQGRSSAGWSEDMVESLGAHVQVDSGEAIRKIVEA